MVINYQKFAISFLALGLIFFVILAVLGLGHMSGMELNENGEMDGCIFTGQTMLCKMSIIDHISRWQSMFTAISNEVVFLVVILILLTAVWIVLPSLPPLLETKKFSEWRLYLARHVELPIFDPLRRAFSRGILQPKIYKAAGL